MPNSNSLLNQQTLPRVLWHAGDDDWIFASFLDYLSSS